MWHWLEIKKHPPFNVLIGMLDEFVLFKHFFPLYCTLLLFKKNMHNDINVMFIWMSFLIVQHGFDLKANWQIIMCQSFGFVFFDANMNYVHCINAYNEDLDDDDIVMYRNFWSMFCKPLLYRLIIQCHVTCCCCCFLCLSCKRLLIKSNS